MPLRHADGQAVRCQRKFERAIVCAVCNVGGQSMRNQRAFTLKELMVTLAVASILIGIAVPSYFSQVRKSRRVEAKTALLDLAGREERFFNSNNVYTNISGNLGYGTATTAMTGYSVGSGYYQVKVDFTSTSVGSYVITAVPWTTDQKKDLQCQSFSVDNTGLQKAFTSTRTDSTANCW